MTNPHSADFFATFVQTNKHIPDDLQALFDILKLNHPTCSISYEHDIDFLDHADHHFLPLLQHHEEKELYVAHGPAYRQFFSEHHASSLLKETLLNNDSFVFAALHDHLMIVSSYHCDNPQCCHTHHGSVKQSHTVYIFTLEPNNVLRVFHDLLEVMEAKHRIADLPLCD